MDDLDFDQLFADKMRQAGAPDMSDADWKPLSARLDAFDRKRHRVMPLWWLGMLTGMLFLSNFTGWALWYNNNQKTTRLQEEWQKFQYQTLLMRDTVVQKTTVYLYDTVRITTRTTPFTGAGMNTKTNLSNTEISVTDSNMGKLAIIYPLPAPALPDSFARRTPRLPDQDLQMIPQVVKKAPVTAILRHSRWGFSAGTMQANAKTIAQSSGFIFGIAGEIPVSEHFSFTANADYGRVKLKGYVYDEGLGLPPLNPPGTAYDFVYFETHDGSKPVVNLGLGAKYWISPAKPWSPFFGAAYQAQWHPEFELEMEYRNRDTGEDKSTEQEVETTGSPLSMLELNLGFRYRITSHLHLMATGFYQTKLNPEKDGIPRYLGLKAAFLYEL